MCVLVHHDVLAAGPPLRVLSTSAPTASNSTRSTSFYVNCEEGEHAWSISNGPRVSMTKHYEQWFSDRLRSLKLLWGQPPPAGIKQAPAMPNRSGRNLENPAKPFYGSFSAVHGRFQISSGKVSIDAKLSEADPPNSPSKVGRIPSFAGDPDVAARVCAKDFTKCAGFCANPFLERTYFYDGDELRRRGLFMMFENTPKYDARSVSAETLAKDRARKENRWFCYGEFVPPVVKYLEKVIAVENGAEPVGGGLTLPGRRGSTSSTKKAGAFYQETYKKWPPKKGAKNGEDAGQGPEDDDEIDDGGDDPEDGEGADDDPSVGPGETLIFHEDLEIQTPMKLNENFPAFNEGTDGKNIQAMKEICSAHAWRQGLSGRKFPLDGCQGLCYNRETKEGRFYQGLFEETSSSRKAAAPSASSSAEVGGTEESEEQGALYPKKKDELYQEPEEDSAGKWACFFAKPEPHKRAADAATKIQENFATWQWLHRKECRADAYSSTLDCLDPNAKMNKTYCRSCNYENPDDDEINAAPASESSPSGTSTRSSTARRSRSDFLTHANMGKLFELDAYRKAMNVLIHDTFAEFLGPGETTLNALRHGDLTTLAESDATSFSLGTDFKIDDGGGGGGGGENNDGGNHNSGPDWMRKMRTKGEFCRATTREFINRKMVATLGLADNDVNLPDVCEKNHPGLLVKASKNWFLCCKGGKNGKQTEAGEEQRPTSEAALPDGNATGEGSATSPSIPPLLCEPIQPLKNGSQLCLDETMKQILPDARSARKIAEVQAKCGQLCFARGKSKSLFGGKKYSVDCYDVGVPGQALIPGVSGGPEEIFDPVTKKSTGKSKTRMWPLQVAFL